MPDVNIRVTKVACNTGTGDQDITISGFGTPKAALFILSKAGTDDASAIGDAWLAMGATDGTRQWTIASSSRSVQANTSVGARYMTDMCIALVAPAGTVDGEASLVPG